MREYPYMKYEKSSPFERQIIIAHKTRTSKHSTYVYTPVCEQLWEQERKCAGFRQLRPLYKKGELYMQHQETKPYVGNIRAPWLSCHSDRVTHAYMPTVCRHHLTLSLLDSPSWRIGQSVRYTISALKPFSMFLLIRWPVFILSLMKISYYCLQVTFSWMALSS